MASSDQRNDHENTLTNPMAWSIWLLAVIFVAYKFQTQSSYAVLNSSIAESFSLSLAQISIIGSLYSFAYAIMTILVGGLLDRYGLRVTMIGGLTIVVAGGTLFGFANNIPSLALGQILLGVGGAFGFPGLAYAVREWFSIKHFGLVFGVAQLVAAGANTLGQAAVGYLIVEFEWAYIIFIQAAFGFALLVSFILLMREPFNNSTPFSSSQGSLWESLFRDLKILLVQPIFWQVSLISGITFGTLLGIGIVWGIKLLVAKGFDPTTASSINSILWISLGIGALAIHLVSDYLRSFKLSVIIFLVCDIVAISYLVLSNGISISMAYVIFAAIGFFAGVNAVAFTITTRFCDKAISGTAFGLLTSMSFIVAAALTPLPAKIIEWTGTPLELASLIFPLALLLALFLALLKKETY